MFSMHAARRDLEALSGAEGDRGVVTGDGDFAAQDQRFGVEVMAMIGGNQVRLHAAVHDPIALTTQFRFKFEAIHCRSPEGVDGIKHSDRWSQSCLLAPAAIC